MMASYILDARAATPHFPGIGRYVRSLAAAMLPLLAADERLTLLVDAQQPLRLDGAPSMPLNASPFSLSQQWRVRQAVAAQSADLYHSPYYLMPYVPGATTVLTVYDVIPLRYPQFSSARSRLLFRLTTRLALRAARRVIAITENARQDFIREFGVDAQRITAIPLGVEPSFRPASQAETDAVRAKYGLPDRFALYLGSNKPHKNLVGLVRAWVTLPDPPAGLVVAGAWDDRFPDARRLAESRGVKNISWLGRVAEADLPALYSAARAFVFPSLFEGFGLPVIEAMACGTPVICSNTTALPEVVGDAAVLVEPGDPVRLGVAIQETLGDDALLAQLREKGLRRAARFSWERTAARTLEVYRQAAA
jgi:alpha-1,3-rhamnosyl/mannosyltransferase